MKKRLITGGLLSGVFLFGGMTFAQEADGLNEKAKRYHSLLLKRPGNPTVFSRFVDAWLDTGDKKQLKAWLEQSAKEGGVPEWRVLSALHEYLGEDEAALGSLNEAVKLAEKDASLRLARAKLQAKLLSFEAALKDLDVAKADEKLGVEASKLQGVYLARAGRMDEAVKVWKEVIQKFPKDEELRGDLIEVELVEGLYDDAIAASQDLVKMTKDPYKKALRQLRLGDIQILGNKKEDGLKTYEEIMSATGADTWLEREVLAQIERVFMREDDVQGLRDFFQKLREVYPRRVSVRKALARQMALNGEMDEAIALFQEVIKITPGDVGNREEFISFLETNERWKEAREELKELLKQREQDPLLWERLAGIEEKLKDQDGIKAALAKVWELKKGSPEGLIAVATLYTQAGLLPEAEALLREGQETFPDSGEVTESLASFLIQNEKEEEALKIWTEMAKTADREGLLRVARSLTGHGKSEAAFQMLQARMSEFGEDPLIIAQFCNLAFSVEEAELAIPFGLKLVEQSNSPTDLESAIKTAARVIKRGEKQEEILRELEAKEERGIPSRCLIAELYADQSDTLKALEVLGEAEKADEGLLARFYRVRFDENRGELDGAIASLRKIIELPEGRKTVHIRRLVGLLERNEDIVAALEAVEDWKRMAPGDQAAWKRRAELLSSNGETDQAVLELRRMVGKFGAEEESRALLAAALLESNEHRSAQRIYEQLYEEGEDLTTKLKWVGELAKVAKQEGTLDDLLADFERRKRENSQSVAPLLALAEIYHSLNQYEDRRAALLEASRRRPNDAKLLQHIADVEIRAGEYERAVALLKDAAKRDNSLESKRKLADLYLKNGEYKLGLRSLSEIPKEGNDPRRVEATALSLLMKTEWDLAVQYLAELIGRHESDWRLRYLYAQALKLDGQEEEAFKTYTSLLDVDQTIKGLKPFYDPKGRYASYWRQRAQSAGALGGWSQVQIFNSLLSNERRYLSNLRQGYSSSSSRSVFGLPGTAEEVRIMSFLKANEMAKEFEEDRKKDALASLSVAGVERIDLLRLYLTDRKKLFAKVDELLKESPDDPSYIELWINSLRYGEDEQKKDLVRLQDVLGKASQKDPSLATSLVRTMMSGKLIEKSEAAGIYLDLIEKSSPGKARDNLLASVSSTVLRELAKDSKNEFAPLAKKLVSEALAVEKKPKESGWINTCLSIALNEGLSNESLVLVNRISEWLIQDGKASSLTNSGSNYRSSYSRSASTTLKVPAFPSKEAKGLPSLLASEISKKLKTKVGPDDGLAERRVELQKMLKLKDDKISPEVRVLKPLETLRGNTEEIQFRILRVLVESALGDEQSLQKFSEEVQESNNRDELSLAAGYLWKEKKYLETYKVLTRMRMLTLTRVERKEVDGMLAMVGAELSSKKDLEWDSEPAKRAALRLRKQLTGYNDRPALTAVMVKLGLQKEAEKLNASPTRTVRRSSSSSLRASAKGIAGLVTDGRKEEAVRIAAKLLKSYANNRNSQYEQNRLVGSLNKLELTDAVLEKIHPQDSQSVSRRLTFANFAVSVGKLDIARPVFESLLKDKPDLMAARTGLFLCLPKEERNYDTFLSEKEGEVDTDTLLEVMAVLWQKANNQLDETMLMLDLTAGILNNLTPSDAKERNLSWVNYYVAQATMDSYYNGVSLRNIYRNRDIDGFNEKKTKLFEKAARQVLDAMLKHPQTAEQGFIMLGKAQKNLGIKDEELLVFANEGLRQLIRRKRPSEGQSYSNRLWVLYRNNGSSSSSYSITGSPGPVDYLLAKGDAENLMNEELMALLEKNQPKQFKAMLLAKNLSTTSPEEGSKLFAEWYSEIKKDEKDKERSDELILADLVKFTESVLLFDPKPSPWIQELEKNLTKLRPRNYNGPPGWSEVLVRWLRWAVKHKGEAGASEFIVKFCEGQLGPREQWPLMAELGYEYLPSHLQRPAYGLYQVLSQFCTVDEALIPVVELAVEHDFESITRNFRANNVISRQLQNKQDPKDFSAWIKKTRLFAPSKDGERSPSATLGLLSMVQYLPYNGTDHGKKMQAAIEELELDPLFKPLMLLRYKSENRDKILAELWEPRVDLLKGMVESNAKLALVKIKGWFPNFAAKEGGPNLTEFLESLQAERLVEVRKKAEKWLADGIQIDPNDYQGRKHWAELVQIGQHDPEITGKLVVKSLESVITNPSYRGSSSSYGGIRVSRLDQWAGEFLEQLIESSQSLELAKQVVIVDHLFRSELQKQLVEPSSTGNNLTYYLNNKVDQEIRKFKPAKDSPRRSIEMAFLDWSKKFTPKQQSTFIALFLPSLLENYSVSFEHVAPVTKWADEELRKTSPMMADALITVVQARGALRKSEKENQKLRDRAKEAMVSLLGELDLSTPLALDFSFRILKLSRTGYLFAGLPQWKWLSLKMKSHANGVRNVALSSTLQSFSYLVNQEFTEKKEAATFLMKEIEGTLITSDLLLKYRNNRGRGEWVSHLLPLALSSGDQEMARRLVQQNSVSFRGQLAIILRISDAIDAESAARLVPATTLRYGVANLPHFTKETPAKIAKIVEALPERDRYRFEVMAASMADASNEKDRHKVLRPERLQALAARFAKEAPKDNGPKWQLLNVFASDKKVMASIIEEFKKVAGQNRLTTALALQDESNRSEDGRALAGIIKAWLKSEQEAGRPEILHNEIARLVKSDSGDQSYNIRYAVNELTTNHSHYLLLESIRNPEKAPQFLEMSKKNVEYRLEVDGRGSNAQRQGIVWADYFVHILADETKAWYDRVEKLGEGGQKAYPGQFGKPDQYGLQEMIDTPDYRGDENSALRKALLSAALRDSLFLEKVLTYYTRLSMLMDASLVTRDELFEVIDELPKGHPRLAEFLMERAGIIGWRSNNVKEAAKFYEKARALALTQKNDKIVHLSDALHARLLGQRNRISESWKFGKRVDPKFLPEADQKWFANDSVKWKEQFSETPRFDKLKKALKEAIGK